MNKKILWLLILLLSVVQVKAVSYDMDCPVKVKNGDTITIPVKVNKGAQEGSISAVEGTFTYDSSQLQLNGYSSIIDGWTTLSNSNRFSFGDITFNHLVTSSGTVVFNAKFKVISVPSSGIDLSITNPDMTNENGSSFENVTGDSCNIRLISDNNNLTNLELSTGTLTPQFNNSITEYTATVDSNTVTINYTQADPNSTVLCAKDTTVNCNNISLNYGENKLHVQVNSEAGTTKTYNITITRPDSRDTNNNLKSLTLSKGTVYFEKNKTDYNVNVDADVSKITITATLESNKARFIDYKYNNPNEVSLKYGLNKIEIVVIAENESKKTYTLNITRKDDRDSNNSLSDLTITPGNLDFDPKVSEYKVNVKSDVETIKIDAKTSSKKASVTIDGPDKLNFGANEFVITVTAENTSKKEYKITVIRNEEDTDLSNVALLESLTIEGYDLVFDPELFEYEITSNETKFNILAEAQENGSVYVVNDGKVDENNNLIIRVTAEDGTVNKYIIHVNPVENSKLPITTIIIIILSIFIVIALIYLFANNKDKKNDDQVNSDNTDTVNNEKTNDSEVI